MSELSELYVVLLLDHYKHPRNCCRLEHPTHTAEGANPLCGDHLNVYVKVTDGLIDEITFEGSGCAISRASASMMTAHLKGKTVAEARAIFEQVHRMLTGEEMAEPEMEALGKLAALSGVCEFPVRVKCATLAWHTMRTALERDTTPAKTE